MSMAAKDFLAFTFLVAGLLCIVCALPVGSGPDNFYTVAQRYIFIISAGIYFVLSFFAHQRRI